MRCFGYRIHIISTPYAKDIVVRCVDEDGPLSGKVIRLPLEETLSAIVEDRKRH